MVKWFAERRFGFIRPEAAGHDLYFSYMAVTARRPHIGSAHRV
jgi:cold shock CspA family protein